MPRYAWFELLGSSSGALGSQGGGRKAWSEWLAVGGRRLSEPSWLCSWRCGDGCSSNSKSLWACAAGEQLAELAGVCRRAWRAWRACQGVHGPAVGKV